MTPHPMTAQERALAQIYTEHEHLADAAIIDRAWAAASAEAGTGRRPWNGPTRWLAAAACVALLLGGLAWWRPSPSDRDPHLVASATDRQAAADLLTALAAFPGGPPALILTPDSLTESGVSLQGDTVSFLEAVRNPLVMSLVLSSDTTTGVVVGPDGRREQAGLISQQAAFDQIAAGREPCDACTPVILERLDLVPREIMTATGPATVPMWTAQLQGTSLPRSILAVSPDRLIGYGDPWVASDPTLTGIESWAPGPDPTIIRIRFQGAPPTGPCAATYAAVAAESPSGVALALRGYPVGTAEGDPITCTSRAQTSTLTLLVRLPAPVAGRPVLDVASGAGVTPAG